MQVRDKRISVIGSSDKFNTCSASEIVVYTAEDCTSDFMSNYEVYLENKKEWKDMQSAFCDRDLVVDNYNTGFREPRDEEEREKGWYY